MKTMDFHDFHETLGYSQTTRASKIFSENVLGIGNDLNMSRKSIPSVFRTGMSDKACRKENKNHDFSGIFMNFLIFHDFRPMTTVGHGPDMAKSKWYRLRRTLPSSLTTSDTNSFFTVSYILLLHPRNRRK